MRSELLRPRAGPLRVAWWEDSVSRPGPERPGLGCSLEVRAGDEEELGVGCPAGADPRPLLRRQAHLLLTLWSGSRRPLIPAAAKPPRKGSAQLLATEKPLIVAAPPASGAKSARVAGSLCGLQQPSSAPLPDTSFPTTCFAEVFRSLLQLFSSWELPSRLGPAQGPLEGTPGAPHTLLEMYLAFLEVTHYYLQSVQITLVSLKLCSQGLDNSRSLFEVLTPARQTCE